MREGYDITAYFQDGHSPAEFEQLKMTDIEPYEMATPKPTGDRYDREPVLVRLSDVEPESVRFLWKPYVPIGKITLIEGDPGATKSWLALAISSLVTRGDPFPGQDGSFQANGIEPGNVVYCSAEDGLADTLSPRLVNLHADPNRVFFLTGSRLTSSQS